MRNFNVTVNGKTYLVEVEELGAGSPAAPAPAPTPASAPAAATPAPAPAPSRTAPAGGTVINSPLPGLILGVTVNDGQTVKKGDKIMVLEAMKMEHDIFSPASGKITLLAKKGDKVETGAQLASIQ